MMVALEMLADRFPVLQRRSEVEDSMATAPRILIADDEPNHRRALSISLRLEGYEVAEAVDGQHALDLVLAENLPVCAIK